MACAMVCKAEMDLRLFTNEASEFPTGATATAVVGGCFCRATGLDKW